MTIHLKPELEALIRKNIQRGPYRSVDEFVEHAVQVLHAEEELWTSDREAISEKIERAFEQFERGEGFSAEESRTRLQEQKAAWLVEHRRG